MGEPRCAVLVLEVRLHPRSLLTARQRRARGDGVTRLLLPTTATATATTAALKNEDANRIN